MLKRLLVGEENVTEKLKLSISHIGSERGKDVAVPSQENTELAKHQNAFLSASLKKLLKVVSPKPNRPHLCAEGSFPGFQLALVGNAGGLLFAKVDVSLSGGLVEPPLAVGTLDVVWKEEESKENSSTFSRFEILSVT